METEIDLFQDFDALPDAVQDAIYDFDHNTNQMDTYKACDILVKQLEKIGYTCDYELSGEPFNLRKLDVAKVEIVLVKQPKALL